MKFYAAVLLFIMLVALGVEKKQAENRLESPLRVVLSGNPLTVRFTNAGRVPLRILKPLDGSEWSWVMPYYKLTVTDECGQKMPLMPRCGLFAFPNSYTVWLEHYIVTIPAGGRFELPFRSCHQIKNRGMYDLRFQYVFRPKTGDTPGGVYPPGLWQGEASSNTIRMWLEGAW